MFLTPSDFVGKYKIAKDQFTKELLEEYIEKFEKRYLQELFGASLYDLFVDSLNDNEPPTSGEGRFIKVFNEFYVEDGCGEMYRSEGVLDMLKGFIYYEYVSDQSFKNTIVGTVVNETAFSREVVLGKSVIEERYNLAVQSYISIQLFIIDSKSNYPEFKGLPKRQSYFGGIF